MQSAQQYRQQAEQCRNLAREAKELYVKTELIEMAADFSEIATKLEGQRKRDA